MVQLETLLDILERKDMSEEDQGFLSFPAQPKRIRLEPGCSVVVNGQPAAEIATVYAVEGFVDVIYPKRTKDKQLRVLINDVTLLYTPSDEETAYNRATQAFNKVYTQGETLTRLVRNQEGSGVAPLMTGFIIGALASAVISMIMLR